MRQRVAVARALAMDPEILLLDEPLSALDALTRAKLQDEIESIWREQRKTVVLVTNDVDEALLLADRIIPLKPGPRATLGHEFKVDLPRPRDRTAMNHDPLTSSCAPRSRSTCSTWSRSRCRADGSSVAAAGSDSDHVGDFVPKAVRAANRAEAAVESRKVRRVLQRPQGLSDAEGPLTVVEGFQLDITTRRVRFADRPFRLRQVHRAVDVRRPQRRLRRRHHARRP